MATAFRSSHGEEEEAGDLPAASVNHPHYGRITDPRIAYLVGIAEGMQGRWCVACDEAEAELPF